ncbi:heavy metal-associated isoprenylated plant protein 39 [Elaeis guineensis]
MDMKEKKLTVVGAVDPVKVVSKLRKFWPTNIFSVGPVKEPEKEKKEEPKKEEPKKEEETKKEEPKKEETKKEEPKKEEETKKEEPKKEEAKKEEPKKEEAEKKRDPQELMMMELVNAYKAYQPHMTTHYYVHSAEENPNSCAIL